MTHLTNSEHGGSFLAKKELELMKVFYLLLFRHLLVLLFVFFFLFKSLWAFSKRPAWGERKTVDDTSLFRNMEAPVEVGFSFCFFFLVG